MLGIAFNWGMLMAWSDTQNSVPWYAIAMWAGTAIWQVGYDAIYAYIDMRDDKMLGLKSAAIRFGDAGKVWISAIYFLTILLWLVAGFGMQMAWPYYVVMAVIAVHFVWQMYHFDVKRPERGLRLFRANMQVGVLLIIAALAGTVLGGWL